MSVCWIRIVFIKPLHHHHQVLFIDCPHLATFLAASKQASERHPTREKAKRYRAERERRITTSTSRRTPLQLTLTTLFLFIAKHNSPKRSLPSKSRRFALNLTNTTVCAAQSQARLPSTMPDVRSPHCARQCAIPPRYTMLTDNHRSSVPSSWSPSSASCTNNPPRPHQPAHHCH